ncbi:hypothetical protein PENSPDRAFT_635970 [Peniophora sp. CONT]|nr:hypothetical protein PENSPDRAFT_635970 [Peniophora sp. CONT]
MAPLRDRALTADEATSPASSATWTTPLRISKREHPSQLSRRASNTINRLKSSSLVSQSPFRSETTPLSPPSRPKSSVAAASPRRVSGEKRPRPQSMHAQAENEKPQGFKRRQSNGIAGLAQKEPVSKSPFLSQRATSPPQLPIKVTPSRLPTPKSSVSPVRPSLVSRRLHGPRGLGSSGLFKRERRKTVTFDPNCDVLEFERDSIEMEDEPFYSDDYDDGDESADDMDVYGAPEPTHRDEDDPVEDMVDSMLHESERPHTPPHDSSHLPPDVDTEDGIPYGRTHHSERAREQHSHNHQLVTPPDTSSDHNYHEASGHEAETDMSLEDRDVRMMPPSPSPTPAKPSRTRNSDSANPLPPRFDHDDDPEVQVVELSFLSSSDVQSELDHRSEPGDVSFSAFEAELGLTPGASVSTPPLRTNKTPRQRTSSFEGRKLPEPPAQASIRNRSASPFDMAPPPTLGHSARAGSPLAREGSPFTREGSPFTREGSPFAREGSPFTRAESPFARESSPAALAYAREASPAAVQPVQRPPLVQRMASTDSFASGASSSGSISRPRIRPEDVARKLARKQSPSLSPVVVVEKRDEEDAHMERVDEQEEDERPAPVTSAMRRHDNFTHDGVQELDPEPTDIDPPRAEMLTRAASDGDAYGGLDSHMDEEDDDEEHADPDAARKAQIQRAASFRGLQFDIGTSSGLGLGLGFGLDRTELGEAKSPLHKMVEDVARPVRGHKHVASITEGVPVQALTRPSSARIVHSDSEDEDEQDDEGFFSGSTRAPAVPAKDVSAQTKKDAIKERELAILQKRREARRNDEDEDMGRTTPPRRPRPRRSASTGEIRDIAALMRPAGPDRTESERLGNSGFEDFMPTTPEVDLEASVKRALKRRTGAVENNKYHIREHETIYAVRHTASAGDVAWRPVRRPSDMNEHAAQIRAYRAMQKPDRGSGKVFVRVVGVKGLEVPMPREPTAVACTLNNGVHYVTTPDCVLSPDCMIDQEFELIEGPKLEFTLTLKVRRDPHILAQYKANTPPPMPTPAPIIQRAKPAPPPASKGGMRSFFSSSPKKHAKAIPPPREPSPPPRPAPAVHRVQENLARYLKPDGTLARAFVSFKELAPRCDMRLFETSFPLIGQRLEAGGKSSAAQVGELVLQFFRLPPLPGIAQSELPQSLEDCHRGLRHVQWHKMTYFEGILTQSGGDCTTWRRRQFRVIGANLVAFNDVTKRAAASIDLRKAIRVEDPNAPSDGGLVKSPSLDDDFDFGVGVERSFRVAFRGGEEILFFADSDDEKARWLEVLRALVGRIPPNPLWAELLWQRQQELAKAGSSK